MHVQPCRSNHQHFRLPQFSITNVNLAAPRPTHWIHPLCLHFPLNLIRRHEKSKHDFLICPTRQAKFEQYQPPPPLPFTPQLVIILEKGLQPFMVDWWLYYCIFLHFIAEKILINYWAISNSTKTNGFKGMRVKSWALSRNTKKGSSNQKRSKPQPLSLQSQLPPLRDSHRSLLPTQRHPSRYLLSCWPPVKSNWMLHSRRLIGKIELLINLTTKSIN